MHLSHQGILDVILAELVFTSVGTGDRRPNIGHGVQGVVDLTVDGRPLLLSQHSAMGRSSDTRIRHIEIEDDE